MRQLATFGSDRPSVDVSASNRATTAFRSVERDWAIRERKKLILAVSLQPVVDQAGHQHKGFATGIATAALAADRRRAEGLSDRDVNRCLKRHIPNDLRPADPPGTGEPDRAPAPPTAPGT